MPGGVWRPCASPEGLQARLGVYGGVWRPCATLQGLQTRFGCLEVIRQSDFDIVHYHGDRYGVDMDFMGCTVLNEAGNKNAGKHWVAVSDSRCTSTGGA